MPRRPYVTDFVYEGSGLVLMSRIYQADATPITQADIDSIVLYVRDKADPDTEVANSPYSLPVASVIFNTLQTDEPWSIDSFGYNFRYHTLAEQLPRGDADVPLRVQADAHAGRDHPGGV